MQTNNVEIIDGREVHFIDSNIAFTTGSGKTYINKHLKGYSQEIYERVLKHELGHEAGAYNSDDLKSDFYDTPMPFEDKIKFCTKYPRALSYFLPFAITEDEAAVSWLRVFELGISIAVLLFILFWVI